MTDPFATTTDITVVKKWGEVHNGRYHMPPVDEMQAYLPGYDGKHKPRGYMRTTNLVSAYSDQRALQEWQIEMGLRGLAERFDLYERLKMMPEDATRKDYVKFFEQAKEVAKADEGARRGTARHDMMQLWLERGIGRGTPDMLSQLDAFHEAERAHYLKSVVGLTERIVVCEPLECSGRFDDVVKDYTTGELKIRDLKTQKAFWSVLEVRAQLAVYANATAMWDDKQCCYVNPPRMSLESGIIFWMPTKMPESGPLVSVLEVDLVAGWKTAERAYEVVKDRSEARSKQALTTLARAVPLPTVELYARLLRDVETIEQGSALVREATERGVWCAELAAVARASADRLAPVGS